MPGTIGTCALCQMQNVALRQSHIVPSWAYQRVVAFNNAQPNPVMVDGDNAMLTSWQSKANLLCDRCEQRFGTVEQRISNLLVQADGSFPLHKNATEVSGRDDVIQIPKEDARDLAYFGLSVEWRADVAQVEPIVSLGIATREAVRSFLLAGKGSVPGAVVVLTVLVPAPEVASVARVFTFSETAGIPDEERHEFICLGVRFSVYTGPKAMEKFAAIDAFNGEHVGVSDGQRIAKDLGDAVLASTPTGKLARSGS